MFSGRAWASRARLHLIVTTEPSRGPRAPPCDDQDGRVHPSEKCDQLAGFPASAASSSARTAPSSGAVITTLAPAADARKTSSSTACRGQRAMLSLHHRRWRDRWEGREVRRPESGLGGGAALA